MEGEHRSYLRGLLASFRLTVRMVGGCCVKAAGRFGTSPTGRMVVHNVMLQEGGQGSERWNEDNQGGKTMNVNKENCCSDERIDTSILIC